MERQFSHPLGVFIGVHRLFSLRDNDLRATGIMNREMNTVYRPPCGPKLHECGDVGAMLKCYAPTQFPQDPSEAKKWASVGERSDVAENKNKYRCGRDGGTLADGRRQRILEKLKYEYRIDVDALNPTLVNKLIWETEQIEKQQRTRERRKIENRFSFIKRLVQEDNRRRRARNPPAVTRKKQRKISRIPADAKSIGSEICGEVEAEDGNLAFPASLHKLVSYDEEPEEEKEGEGGSQMTESAPPDKCDPRIPKEPILGTDFFGTLRELHDLGPEKAVKPLAKHFAETCLKCCPSTILFENCKPNRTYVRSYRITNVGLEMIHCRYLGIEVKDEDEDVPVPFRVVVPDNALLHSGMSCAAKIRMFSISEIPELDCYLVYETRRKRNPTQHGYFRIPLVSTPERSMVEVAPLVVRFPSVTWCDATGPQRSKSMTKTIKITNTGAKECSCKISKHCLEAIRNRMRRSESVEGEFGPENSEEREQYNRAGMETGSSVVVTELEYLGEEYYLPRECPYAEEIIDELIENVFEVFRFDRKYFIPVPPMSVVTVKVEFFPEYKGYHHNIVFFQFEGARNCDEEKIEMIGDIKRTPLRTDPPTVDLKICTINSGVYEGTFKVCNDSNGSYPVRLKVPGSMKRHALVFPKAPILQPRDCQICSVRLFPGITIADDAFRYYKEDTQVLEFPVFIEPTGQGSCKSDRIKLYVFAILTNYALELNPEEIDFGTASTLETVRTELTLTNHSMAAQEYGFLHLPVGIRIEPNYGFGEILPKEVVKLHVLYSPVVNPCAKNAAQEEGIYKFRIQVTSISELGGFRERERTPTKAEFEELEWSGESYYHSGIEEEMFENYQAPENSEFGEYEQEEVGDGGPGEDEDEDEEEACEDEKSLIDYTEELRMLQEKQNKIRDYLRQSKEQREEAAESGMGTPEKSPNDSDRYDRVEESHGGELSAAYAFRKDMNVIRCTAYLINPNCELSSTMIQLPATPLYSFSLARFCLIGTDIGARNKCICGNAGKARRRRNEARPPAFEALFEFDASSESVTIEPRSGRIVEGQSLPVAIIFRPELSKSQLKFEAKVLKAETNHDEEDADGESTPQKSASTIETSKAPKQPSRPSKVEVETRDVDLAAIDVSRHDLFAGERMLQQMVTPFYEIIKVECVVKTPRDQESWDKIESHSLMVIAPVVKPSFTYLGNCQEMSFGKVVVGGRARKLLEIRNISQKRIAPQITALNPHGPFFCTTGCKIDRIDPEHTVRHPLTFAPTDEEGKVIEFFEIRHGSTSITLKVNGEGIMPSYVFTPDFALCLMEAANDQGNEVELTVRNTCEGELHLQFVIEFVGKSNDFKQEGITFEDVVNNGKPEQPKRDKKQPQTLKESAKRIAFVTKMSEEMSAQLDREFVPVDEPSPDLFKLTGLDSDGEAALPPSGKMQIGVAFSPPNEDFTRKEEENAATGATAYAVRYAVMLARTTPLRKLTETRCLNAEDVRFFSYTSDW